jgi:hypothetical protein
MTDICAGPPLRQGDGVGGGAGVDSAAWGGVAIDAGVDAAAGDKSAAGPTSMTVCGLWVVEGDVGDGSGDMVALSAVGDVTPARDGAAADGSAVDLCSIGEKGAAAGGRTIGVAFAAAEYGAAEDDEAALAARSEESSAAEDGADGDDCAAGDGCIEADDAGGAAASVASLAIFGVTSAEGMPVGDPAVAVAFVDAAFVDDVLLAVDATADLPTRDGTPALVADRLATDAGLAASFAAVCRAFNGAAADAGIDDSVIGEDASGGVSTGPPESRAWGALSASEFIGISTMRACGASGTSTVCLPA